MIEAFAVLAFLYLVCQLVRHRKYGNLPLPPGPKGLPLIGNLRDMPSSFEWKTYHQWCKDFSRTSLFIGNSFLFVIR